MVSLRSSATRPFSRPSTTCGCIAALASLALMAAACNLHAQTMQAVVAQDVVLDNSPSTGAAWVDIDSDRDLDLYVFNGNLVPAPNLLYLNDGHGGLQLVSEGPAVEDSAPSIGGCWGDMDGDGDPDLFVANRENAANALYRNDGGGVLTLVADAPPSRDAGNSNSASWVDVDSDGDLDLFVLNFGQPNFLYLNDGSGNFETLPESLIATEDSLSINASWADIDSDGDLDVFFGVGGSQGNELFINVGEGMFTRVENDPVVADGGASIGSSFGDFDNDGDPDLFVANFLGQNNFLYTNNGDGSFIRVTNAAPTTDGGRSVGSAFVDLDHDGDLDLVVGNDGEADFLYRNLGDGTFERVLDGDNDLVTRVGNTFGVAPADFDRDGDQDLFIADRLGNNALLVNTGNDFHWLQLELVGSGSNTSAIGARVTALATVAGREIRQTRDVVSQSGYNSEASLEVDLGLGNATAVSELIVRWPSGRVQTFTGVTADRHYRLREGGWLVSHDGLEPPPTAAD